MAVRFEHIIFWEKYQKLLIEEFYIQKILIENLSSKKSQTNNLLTKFS